MHLAYLTLEITTLQETFHGGACTVLCSTGGYFYMSL